MAVKLQLNVSPAQDISLSVGQTPSAANWDLNTITNGSFEEWRPLACDRLCGLVVRVSGYRYRGPGFDPGATRFSVVVVGLERGPLSLVRSIEELLEWKKKVAAPGLEKQ